MHYKKYKSIISNKNGINLYRGCTHGCIYCDSRSTCYQINHDFEDIEVKENAPLQFREQLGRKRKKAMIGFGSMCDPYMPIEKKLNFTRDCLKSIYDYGFGVSVLTKSDLILRDLDILKKINEKTKCVVNITITTFDDNLCSLIEPNVCLSSRRFEVLEEFRKNNIPTIVWLCPILPFINDNEENILKIVENCGKVETYGIMNFQMGLTLREGNREYFYKKLDQLFPGLKNDYIRIYGNSYGVSSFYNTKLMSLLHREGTKRNIITNPTRLFEYMNKFEQKNKEIQLSLF